MPEEGFNGDYFIFTESYFNEFFRRKITDLPLFSQESKPIFLLDAGFDDPAHFNHFFKKQTRHTPSDFRA